MRIVFDDLRRRDPTWPPEWEMWAFITNAELPLEGFPRELTERQLAAIGRVVVSRLWAQWKPE